MRVAFLIIYVSICLNAIPAYAQELPATGQLEELAAAEETESEDDTFLQRLELYRKYPLDINRAGMDEWKDLGLLNELQIASLLDYRRLLGPFIDLHELQAVPGIDISLIRQLLPFITIGTGKTGLRERFSKGEHSVLLRVSQVLEQAKGFKRTATGGKAYAGSPQRLFFRYRYAYSQQLQYGLTAEKDAGEEWFQGSQRRGFDFYSAHLFVRDRGAVRCLALGDFTVNIGQGLIHWQSLAFKKSGEVLAIKRQSPVLRPYNSAGEFNFHRGLGITGARGKWEASLFFSYRKLSASIDSTGGQPVFTSFRASGYHRTATELAGRNRLIQKTLGAVVKYKYPRGHLAVNAVSYKFSLPMQKREWPYNLFALAGDSWHNTSFDYSHTARNLHIFGELAADRYGHTAMLHGLLVSMAQEADLSVVYRSLSKAYQAVYGNAFTENTAPSNEKGLYMGLSLRPTPFFRLDAYADIYLFPWLRYRVDAPAKGQDYLVQLSYLPSRESSLVMRFRYSCGELNQRMDPERLNSLATVPRQNWRVHLSHKPDRAVTLRQRYELVWYNRNAEKAETGFLFFQDILYKPARQAWGLVLRWQYFETEGYNSRLYAYENDVLYSYSIPVIYDKGHRCYMVLDYDINKRVTLWLRWARTVFADRATIGSGQDEIQGKRRTEVKLQGRWIL